MHCRRFGKRIAGGLFFIGAAGFASLAIWLCVLGELPSIRIGEHSHLIFGGMIINGMEVPDWAFYFIPGMMFLASIGLSFVGWYITMRGHEEAQSPKD